VGFFTSKKLLVQIYWCGKILVLLSQKQHICKRSQTPTTSMVPFKVNWVVLDGRSLLLLRAGTEK
jgi:hypothetical protein